MPESTAADLRDSVPRAGEAHVLVVDDEPMMRNMLERELPRLGFRVTSTASGEEGIRLAQAEDFAVAVVDIFMPGIDGMETLRRFKQESPATEVVLLTGHGTIEGAVAGMRAGAYDYLTKPCRLAELGAVLGRAIERRALRRENAALRRLVTSSGAATPAIVAASPAMRAVVERIERVAPSDSSVLIQGESGTGKELVARALHDLSRRREKPFVVINCSAIPEALFESELFGHQRGAFTGATERRLGLVEAADGGTLFLDEIGEMGASVQSKLLRALESGEIRRVGENRTTRVNVRVLAASNKNLLAETTAGRFREDLFYRLNGVLLEIPPLRARPEDVELLVRHFLAASAVHGHHVESISPEALEVLRSYVWPGNVRELKNAIETLLVLAHGPRIEVGDLPPSLKGGTEREGMPWEGKPLVPLEQVVEEYVQHALERCGGNKSQAARALGIDPKTLYKRIKR